MLNHTFLASFAFTLSDAQQLFIERSLQEVWQEESHHAHRFSFVLDGYGFAWQSVLLPQGTTHTKQGLLRYAPRAQVSNQQDYTTIIALDAPAQAQPEVSTISAEWLVAYSDNLWLVWDGDSSNPEGAFIKQVLDMALQARLDIVWINPVTSTMRWLSGRQINTLELARLQVQLTPAHQINDFMSDFHLSDWRESCHQLRNTLREEYDAIRAIPQKLSWSERIAGGFSKSMFALIAKDWQFFKKQKYLNAGNASYYGAAEGNNIVDITSPEKVRLSNPIQQTDKVDKAFLFHDKRGSLSAQRQRSSYWWIALFNLAAVVLSLLGVGIEWIALLMAMALGKIVSHANWSKHWLESRQLAETLRFTRMLYPLLVSATYQRQPIWHNKATQDQQDNRWQVSGSEDWLSRRLFRVQGWPVSESGAIYAPQADLIRLKWYLHSVLQDQHGYHSKTHQQQKAMVKNVGWFALIVGGFATVLSWTQHFPILQATSINLLITLLPAMIGAMQGILAQIEAGRLSQQSEATMHFLALQMHLVEHIDEANHWQYYQMLRHLASQAGEAMITENQGWKKLLSSR
jgi:hypothetical protein